MGAIVPTVVDAVDPDDLIDRLDVDALMAKVDVDALLTRIDIDALLERIDVDALLQRIDVSALIARIDMNEVIGKVDLNALLADVDLNALMDDVDIKAIVAKAGIDQIVAEASTGIMARTLDLARRQLVGVDIIILGAIDRILRRRREELTELDALTATGRPAGPVSRMVAFGLDLFFVSALFSVVAYFGRAMVELFTGDIVQPTRGAGIAWAVGYFAWFGLYLWGSIEITGRTPGKALVGLRVVALDGAPLGPGRAFVRTLVFPFSFILGLGFIPGVVRRDRRALHELVAGCHEIVDWGDRDAGLPSALEGWIARQRDAQLAALAGVPVPAAVATAAGVPEPEPETIEVRLDITPSVDEEAAEAAEAAEEPIAAMSSRTVLVEAVDPDALLDADPDASDGAAPDGDEDYWASS